MTNMDKLSNLEIRNLLLEVLAYEGDDIDTEGKTFKMYGYQGSQSDLFRLLNGYLIKKNIKPEKVKMYGAAWGGEGRMLHEYQTINLSKGEILKLYQEFHRLLTQGVIAPGAYGNYGTSLPYFHVTEYGMECIKKKDFLPYDQDGYLSKLKSITDINDWVVFYVTEALKCFNADCVNSSMINIGLAGEVIIEELANSFEKFLLKNEASLHSSFQTELAKDWKISFKYNTYLDFQGKYIKATKDKDVKALTVYLDKSSSSIYATFTRLTRNTVTHPNDIIMDRTQVLMFFITLVNYCELQYNFINHYKNNS
ncbi:hypothetical protein [Niallia endozanthoxylica]|uniref:Uncharacterized protein n=1 Tax=Niallia endozanthoxylica TaxID=2036016 RepID=A0A5J5GY32_9BACI|nr:hypothetical protein [Niallia endozanthoxylica]KAA9012282.1 hypothetical protein F4V44_25820 [Niallia endozanthoxylica]